MAFRTEMRRFRQQHARQRIQVGHAGARQAQLQIDAGQRARVRQGAGDAGLVLAQHGVRLHGIDGVVVGQGQHGARLAAARHGRLR